MTDVAAMFAQIATGISAAFGGPYFAARIITSTGEVRDAGGSITTPGTPVYRTCQAQIDACTEAMRAADGYSAKDVRVLVLAATLAGEIDTDAYIEMLAGPDAGVYSIQTVGHDPMTAYRELRARPV